MYNRLQTGSGREQIIQQQKDLPQNAEIIGKMTAAGVTSLGVATAALASGDQTLGQVFQTLMNPANTFDFIQKNPEAAAILNKFKNGEFNDIESAKNAMNQLASALGVNVDVLTTTITDIYGLCMYKGAVHNFELFKRNLHLIPKDAFVLADKGYQGIYDIYVNSLIPLKAKKGCKFDPILKKYNREINKRRIGVEHVFGVLKTFKILAE